MPIRLNRSTSASRLEEIVGSLPDTEPANSSAPLASSGPAQDDAPLAPPFLSLREAAEWLCVSISSVKRLIAKGELIAVRIGARRKIPGCSLEAYVTRDILIPNTDLQPIDNDLNCTGVSNT